MSREETAARSEKVRRLECRERRRQHEARRPRRLKCTEKTKTSQLASSKERAERANHTRGERSERSERILYTKKTSERITHAERYTVDWRKLRDVLQKTKRYDPNAAV